MKIADIAKIIEAVLFVAGDGVDRDEFKRIYDLSDKEINKCIDILKERYNENTGVNIITYKNKLQLCSNPELADAVAEILNPIRERSLTKAALETIAIIAYKQPITRGEIEQVRGVNCDYAIQLLQSNNLIEVVGRKDAVGKPLLFGTTDNFLKRFELESLDALPNYKELLDRIRVIHSEGDSLYREFGIPDEQNDTAEVQESATESSQEIENNESVDVKVVEDNNENTESKLEKSKQSKRVKKVEIDVNLNKIENDDNASKGVQNLAESSQNKKQKSSVKHEKIDNNEGVDSNNQIPEKELKEIGQVKKKTKTEAQDSEEKPIATKKTNNKTEQTKVEREQQSTEPPKLSWRDKMRAKMDANSHHYENLNDYMETKKE